MAKAVLIKERAFYTWYTWPKCSYTSFLDKIRRWRDRYEAIQPRKDPFFHNDEWRVCSWCNQFKPWSEYYTHQKWACKECVRARQRSYDTNSVRRYKEKDAILREKKKNDRSYFWTNPKANSQAFRNAVENKEEKKLYQPKYEPPCIELPEEWKTRKLEEWENWFTDYYD